MQPKPIIHPGCLFRWINNIGPKINIETATKEAHNRATKGTARRNYTFLMFISVIHFVKNPIAYIFAIENRKYQYVNTNILFPLPSSW